MICGAKYGGGDESPEMVPPDQSRTGGGDRERRVAHRLLGSAMPR